MKNLNRIRFPYYISFITLILVCTACKQDCEIPNDISCPNYDPCWEEEPVAANFTMWEVLPNDTLLRAYEAVFMNRTLVLQADQEGLEEYQWKIGADPTIRTGPVIQVEFDAPYGPVDITLVVNSTPNSACNPADDGRDTIRQTIRVLASEDLSIWGTYTGFEEGEENEPFSITLSLDSTQFGFRPLMQNLPRGCTTVFGIGYGANGFSIEENNTGDCLQIYGFAYVTEQKDSLICTYYRQDRALANQTPPIYQQIETPFTFIGVRQ